MFDLKELAKIIKCERQKQVHLTFFNVTPPKKFFKNSLQCLSSKTNTSVSVILALSDLSADRQEAKGKNPIRDKMFRQPLRFSQGKCGSTWQHYFRECHTDSVTHLLALACDNILAKKHFIKKIEKFSKKSVQKRYFWANYYVRKRNEKFGVLRNERLKYTLKWRVYFILQFASQTCLLFVRSHFIANAHFWTVPILKNRSLFKINERIKF